MFNKIAITGHTSGIGNAMFDALSETYTVIGFSKSNGYNIDDSINRIIEDSIDCEVFINNAYSGSQQCVLADAWVEAHRTKSHLLINISSMSSDPEFVANDWLVNDNWFAEYSANKKALTKKGWDINYSENCCNCVTIIPGITNTKFVNPTNFPNGSKLQQFYNTLASGDTIINPSEVANTVKWVLENYNERSFVSSITIMNRVKWGT